LVGGERRREEMEMEAFIHIPFNSLGSPNTQSLTENF
jgi:hypothetical protein